MALPLIFWIKLGFVIASVAIMTVLNEIEEYDKREHRRTSTWKPKPKPTAKPTAKPTPISEVNYRLPLNIKPTNYDVYLTLFMNNNDSRKFTFDGECLIRIQALQKTKQIQLHIMDLNIESAEYYKLNAKSETSRPLPKASPNSLTNIVVYNLDEELQANVSYVLSYVYKGVINTDMRGLYRSEFRNKKNATKSVVSSQLQPFDTRCVLPCFDEPNFKAPFNLKLKHDKKFFLSKSTTIEKDELNFSKYLIKVYTTTDIMPTYFLNFIIADLSDVDDGNFIMFYSDPHQAQTYYAYKCGTEITKALHKYFYTNENIFKHRIIFKAILNSEISESMLLYDERQSTLKAKQAVANIVAYEIARLFFGYLVTCAWWSFTWMNEGFATYFQYFGIHLADSSFNMPSQFVVDVIHTMMTYDATSKTYPISNENVRTKTDIMLMFNSISNYKGASFIHMTKHILGESNFRESLVIYLVTHKYKNTIPLDLFTIWEQYWPVKFRNYSEKYFNSFTRQVGYPVVTFKRTSKTTVEISQKRFLLKDFDIVNTTLTYTVPITYTTSSENDFESIQPKLFLEPYPANISVSEDTTWIIGNIQETGFYRVNYDNESWYQISNKLFSESRNEIHALNRAQIVDDLFNLARAGVIGYSLALNILKYLEFENDYLPWTAAFNGFGYLMTRLGNKSDIFAPFIRDIIKGPYNTLGFQAKNNNNYNTLDIFNRENILDWSCKLGISDCITIAKSYFNKPDIPADIRSIVYCTIMREGKESDFNTLYTKYKTENIASEKTLIFDSLSCIKDKQLVDKFFKIIISDAEHQIDKAGQLCNLCIKNNENVDMVFDLIVQNFEKLAKAIGGYPSIAATVYEIAGYFTTEDQFKKLKSFINQYSAKFEHSISTLKAAENNVEFNLKWSKEKLGSLKEFMNDYLQKKPT